MSNDFYIVCTDMRHLRRKRQRNDDDENIVDLNVAWVNEKARNDIDSNNDYTCIASPEL